MTVDNKRTDFDITMEEGRRGDQDGRSLAERRKVAQTEMEKKAEEKEERKKIQTHS